MASVKSVDEASVEKKLMGAKNTQESIQSLCLWALHHKAQHDNIVKIWLNILKKSKIQRRLTLFYLCNEIVQTCKRKHAIMYKDAFKEVLRDAVLLVRDNSVRNNIERIFSIWEERSIYDCEFIEDLTAILNNTKIRPSAAKLLAEFKPSKLRENIGKIAKLEKETEGRRRRMSSLNIDVTSQNYLKLLKDRSHGKQYTQQIEDSHHHLEEYVNCIEKEFKERQKQQELLEQSELFYDAQYGEAKIVTNAYKNFGMRVTNLRKKLDDVRRTLPDPLSPIPSPTMDAPSPVESVADATEDNTETVDMEMSDAEDDKGNEHRANSPSNTASSAAPTQPTSALDNLTSSPPKEMHLKPLKTKSVSLPSAPENPNSPSDSPVIEDAVASIDYNSTFMSRLSGGCLPSFSLQFNNSIPETAGLLSVPTFANDDSSSAVPDDDGGGTPVQDEKPETTRPTVDPVALLNQLLSCTKKSSSGGTDFLKSLTVLTQSMNVPFKPVTECEKSKKQQIEETDVTSRQSKSTDEQSPQFQPFYHSEDYFLAKPHSSHTNSGSNGQTLETKPAIEPKVTDSNYKSLHVSEIMELDQNAPLLPPPLPPAFNYSSVGYNSMEHLQPSGQSDSGVATALFTERVESNGNPQHIGNEGILNIRPDLVEMLKNVLNTTKSPALDQGVPDVVDPGLSAPKPPLQTMNVPTVSAAGYEFKSTEENGDYIESLRTTGFSSSVSDSLTSTQKFQHYMNTEQQRTSLTFPMENEFHGSNFDAHNLPEHLEPNLMHSKGDQMPLCDNYNSHALSTQPFPSQSPIMMPHDMGLPITSVVSVRNRPEINPPEMPSRSFGHEYINNERSSGDGLHRFDIRPVINRFPEPQFFDLRPRCPPEFNQGIPTRHFAGGAPARFPPLRPPPRFVPRGFYPPYQN